MTPLPTELPGAGIDTAPQWQSRPFEGILSDIPAIVSRTAAEGKYPLINREALEAHLQTPECWRRLPDGRPLRLTAEAMEYILDDFGGYKPDELRSAHRVLYFATRTREQMYALWVPAVPRADDEEEPEVLALHMRALQAEISAWAGETFQPGAHAQAKILASRLWGAVMERMPVSAEKKAPAAAAAEVPSKDAASAGSDTSVGSSPEAIPGTSPSCSSAPTSSTSPPAGSAGATTTGSP